MAISAPPRGVSQLLLWNLLRRAAGDLRRVSRILVDGGRLVAGRRGGESQRLGRGGQGKRRGLARSAGRRACRQLMIAVERRNDPQIGRDRLQFAELDRSLGEPQRLHELRALHLGETLRRVEPPWTRIIPRSCGRIWVG